MDQLAVADFVVATAFPFYDLGCCMRQFLLTFPKLAWNLFNAWNLNILQYILHMPTRRIFIATNSTWSSVSNEVPARRVILEALRFVASSPPVADCRRSANGIQIIRSPVENAFEDVEASRLGTTDDFLGAKGWIKSRPTMPPCGSVPVNAFLILRHTRTIGFDLNG